MSDYIVNPTSKKTILYVIGKESVTHPYPNIAFQLWWRSPPSCDGFKYCFLIFTQILPFTGPSTARVKDKSAISIIFSENFPYVRFQCMTKTGTFRDRLLLSTLGVHSQTNITHRIFLVWGIRTPSHDYAPWITLRKPSYFHFLIPHFALIPPKELFVTL